MPPSEATSQYPPPSGVAAMPTTGLSGNSMTWPEVSAAARSVMGLSFSVPR
jgi:hypothetical protein